jgi:hypothetical protein
LPTSSDTMSSALSTRSASPLLRRWLRTMRRASGTAAPPAAQTSRAARAATVLLSSVPVSSAWGAVSDSTPLVAAGHCQSCGHLVHVSRGSRTTSWRS